MRLTAVGATVLAMCGALLLGAASASANWGSTITFSPAGGVPLGAVDNRGVLHADYQLTAANGDTLDRQADVSPDGHVVAGHSALDRRGLRKSTQDPATTFTFLANGDAVRCAMRRNLSAYFYSPSGALIKTVKLADGDKVYDLNGGDYCEVVSTGDSAAIVWSVTDGTGFHGQPVQQLLVSRILPGRKLSGPVPALPPGADQQALFVAPSLAVTKTGWIAVAWQYINPSKENQSSVTEVTQWRARWISPAGAFGPVIALERARAETCRFQSSACRAHTSFHLGAVADRKVMVVAESQSTWGTLDTAGGVSARTALPFPFPPAGVDSLAFGDYKAMATWWSPKSGTTVSASEWSRGRWSATRRLAQGHGHYRVYPTDALMSQRGEGCVVWYRTVDPGFKAGAYAVFDR